MLNFLAQQLYLPPKASTVAPHVDVLFNAILAVTAFFCLLIFVGMLVFAVKYRHRPGREGGESPGHSTALELTWTIIPTIIVLVIFYYGFRGFLDETVVPPNAYEIGVQSRMWNWSFVYPNGHVDPQLHIPVDRPIRLVVTSEDVIHSVYIPAFRLQKSTVPGRYNRFWVEAKEKGEFPVYCAQYCGTNHAEMVTKCVVHDQADFVRWLEVASNPERQPGFTPAKGGEQVMSARGCFQCHTLNGAASTGPTFKDLFGRQEVMSDGSTIVAEENYIRESIYYPQKKIVKGFGPVMPSFLGSLKDREVDWIIAFLKTQSANFKGGDANPTAPAAAPANAAPAAAPAAK
ncbi:MAG TPA: cytochrome c oxidase subunit II [Tepidisphaeraceae bacterium]|jgi:cytochrome c oxidase subunit 2